MAKPKARSAAPAAPTTTPPTGNKPTTTATTGSTNKSMPAPAVKFPSGATGWFVFVFAFAIIMGIAQISSIVRSGNEKKKDAASSTQNAVIPLASMPQSQWSKLTMPAEVGGKSEMIPVPPGMKTVKAGERCDIHTVYVDGRDCSFKESGSCPVGAYAGIYAVNEGTEANTCLVAFAPM
ncbi:MAG: hypothetical protein Q8L52_01470 [bacterium]|nr:hypothetical protein [bacterium]